MTDTNSFKITFGNYCEFEDNMEYYDYELYKIETGMELLLTEKNINIKSIYIDSGGYDDRLNWRTKSKPNYIYHKCDDKIIIKEKHPDLIKKTLFSFNTPNTMDNKNYMSHVNLIYEYVNYVKNLDFCEIYSYDYIEIKGNQIVVHMNSESG
jgi:hypothetical protein